MKLLVDIGNSRLKWAFSTPEGLSTGGDAALESLSGMLPASLLSSGPVPTGIRVANVAGPAIGTSIATQLRRRYGLQPVFAGSASAGGGVVNGYHEPRQLGVDRWLAICAAYARHRSAIWVVDAGTATTLDHVTADGSHRGGLILPGIDLMEAVLFKRTGNLARLAAGDPVPEGDRPRGPGREVADVMADGMELGRDTATAIRMGALQATISVIVRYLSATDAPHLVVTGGLGRRLRSALEQAGSNGSAPGRAPAVDFRPALVLEGLALDPPCFTEVDPSTG